MATMEQPAFVKNGPPEAGWVTRLANRDSTGAEYQELKFAIHRKLLDRINLEALSSLAGERARAEIRVAVARGRRGAHAAQPGRKGTRHRRGSR